MSTILERREAAYAEATDLVEKAMNGDAEAAKSAPLKLAEVEAFDQQWADYEKSQDLLNRLKDGQKNADPDVETNAPAGGVGDLFIKSAGFAAFKAAHPTGVDGGTPVDIKATGLGGLEQIGFKAASTLTTASGQPSPERLPGYVDLLVAPQLTILDLISTGHSDSATLEYAQIVSENDGSAIVAEGALKPLSDITTAIKDAKVFTYADGFDATNQFLSDEPALAAFMNQQVQRHLRGKIEDQVLNGAGGSSAPYGILATSGVQAQAFDTDIITTIAKSLEKLDATATDVQAVVVNPSVAWGLRLLKDGQGRYLSGGPFSEGKVLNLWGIPIVTSRRVAANKAVIGDFRTVHLLERDPLSVLLFNQHKDYAQRNMVYVRAEWRGKQPIYAPRDLLVATLTGA